MNVITKLMLLFILSSALFAQPTQWELKSEHNEVQVWMFKANPLVTATFEERKNKKKIDWNKVGSEDFFTKLEGKKSKVLGLMGVKDWKVNQKEWKPEKKGSGKLVLKGSYVDSKGRKIKFQEVHIYKDSETRQVLATWPLEVKSGEQEALRIIEYLITSSMN